MRFHYYIFIIAIAAFCADGEVAPQCPDGSTDSCGGTVECDNCVFSCTCEQSLNELSCPDNIAVGDDCGTFTQSDGCRGTFTLECGCSSIGTDAGCDESTKKCVCSGSAPECPATLSVGDDCEIEDGDGCGGTATKDCTASCDAIEGNTSCNAEGICVCSASAPECPANFAVGDDCEIEGGDGCGGTATADCTASCDALEGNTSCNEEGKCVCSGSAPECPVDFVLGTPCSITAGDGCDGTATTDCSENCVAIGGNAACSDVTGRCECSPTPPRICPVPTEGGACENIPATSNGCGGNTDAIECGCVDGQVCNDSNICVDDCPATCNVDLQNARGDSINLNGICSTTVRSDLFDAGPCDGDGCGRCYVDGFDPNLCPSSPQGRCSGGRCGCFATKKGASCKADNFLNPDLDPIPSGGGGCEENFCNSLASQAGVSAACCPVCPTTNRNRVRDFFF